MCLELIIQKDVAAINHDDYDFECDCVCKPKHNNHNCDDECETCQVESDECVENLCSEGSCYPLSAPKYSTANSNLLL